MRVMLMDCPKCGWVDPTAPYFWRGATEDKEEHFLVSCSHCQYFEERPVTPLPPRFAEAAA